MFPLALCCLPRGSLRSVPVSQMRFRVWDAMQASMSGPDKKDSSDFKYVSYSEFPPFTPYHRSLMAKTLQQDRSLWDKLKDRKTSKGYTFSNAIQTGVQTPHLGVGITAGDEESWEVFKEIMYPVIRGWHNFDPETQFHKSDLNPENLKFTEEQVKLFNEYVVSTRIRAARNVSGYSLPAGATDEERTGVEKVLRQAFSGLSGELKGKYYPLYEMSATDEAFLRDNGFLFQKPAVTNLLTNAGAARNWPQGRGIFHNDTRTALCWCNEEDHCRIISMEEGGNVKSVFARFSQLSDALKSSAEANGTKLMFSDRLGFLGTCPSNLGTGLRASVMIRLPEFNKDPALLEAVSVGFPNMLHVLAVASNCFSLHRCATSLICSPAVPLASTLLPLALSGMSPTSSALASPKSSLFKK